DQVQIKRRSGRVDQFLEWKPSIDGHPTDFTVRVTVIVRFFDSPLPGIRIIPVFAIEAAEPVDGKLSCDDFTVEQAIESFLSGDVVHLRIPGPARFSRFHTSLGREP